MIISPIPLGILIQYPLGNLSWVSALVQVAHGLYNNATASNGLENTTSNTFTSKIYSINFFLYFHQPPR